MPSLLEAVGSMFGITQTNANIYAANLNAGLSFNGVASISGATLVSNSKTGSVVIAAGKKGRIQQLSDVGAMVTALSGDMNKVPKFRHWEFTIDFFSDLPFSCTPFILQSPASQSWTTGRDATTSSIPFEIDQWLLAAEYGHVLCPMLISKAFKDNGTTRNRVRLEVNMKPLGNLYTKGYAKLELEARTASVPDFVLALAIFGDPQTVTYGGMEQVVTTLQARKPNWQG